MRKILLGFLLAVWLAMPAQVPAQGTFPQQVSLSSTTALNSTTHRDKVILATGGAGGITLTLPAASDNLKHIFFIKKVDNGAGAVTVGVTGGDTIDGAATWSLASQYDFVWVVSDATVWHVIDFTGVRSTALATLPSAGGVTKVLTWNDTSLAVLGTNMQMATIGITIDGGGSAITTGVKGDIRVPFACTITDWYLLADQSGSIVIDVWKDTYANYPATVADTIAGSEKPTLSTATNNRDTSLSTWTTAVTADDTIRFNVDSATTVTRVNLTIKCQRSLI